MKAAQITQKFFAENSLTAQKVNVVCGKMKVFNVFGDLFKATADGEASFIRYASVENIEVSNFVFDFRLKIAVSHRQLVEVAQ